MKFSTKVLYLTGIIVSAAILLCILWYFPRWQSATYMQRFPPEVLQELKPAERVQLEKNAAEIENSNRVTIAQIIGGLALLSGLYFTYLNVRTAQENVKASHENLRITEEGKLTERFSKAVELLGSDKLDVRLGGIYALERIARDSQKDHWTVMEVLTAFVRENSPNKPVTEADKTKTTPEQNDSVATINEKENIESKIEKPNEDIQAIMTVIGRRKWRASETKPLNLQVVNLSKLNLSELDLSKTNLRGATLIGANLIGANLRAADLIRADLIGADLSEANLRRADLSEANLRRAYLSGADLSGAYLRVADLRRAYLIGADLIGADLWGAYLREVRYLTIEQLIKAEKYDEALLSPELEEQLKKWKEGQLEEKKR